jgi:hypothetical protein
MPTYEVEVNGRRFDVEAPDMETAAAEARRYTVPRTGELRPYEPGLVERGLNALNAGGAVPGVLAGALRDVAAPVSKAVDVFRPALAKGPGWEEAANLWFGKTSRMPQESVNPNEALGSGLATGASVLSLPSAASTLASAPGTLRRAAGKALDSRLGPMVLPASKEPGILATAGRFRQEIADFLKGPNAGGRLAKETLDDASRNAVEELLKEGGRYSDVPLQHPTGGGYTVPPTAQPSGGRLAKPAPTATSDFTTQELLKQPPSSIELPLQHPTGGGFTVPPEVPMPTRTGRPPVTARPAAPQPGAPRPAAPATQAKPTSPPQEAMMQELAKREAADFKAREFIEKDVVSKKARESRNLGAAEDATESYAGLKTKYDEAVKRGDLNEVVRIGTLLRQRLKLTIKQQTREAP